VAAGVPVYRSGTGGERTVAKGAGPGAGGELAAALTTLLKLSGMTRRQVAARAGLEERRVGDWIRGDHVPDEEPLRRLLRTLINAVTTRARDPFPREYARLLDDSPTGPWWKWREAARPRNLSGRNVRNLVQLTVPAAARRVRAGETIGEVFVGRVDEVGWLLDKLAPGNGSDVGSGVVVSAVAGMGGIGKTALARHVAAEVAGRGWFPGGVFWVDLHGYSGEGQVTATSVLAPLLRQLGVADNRIPVEVGEQATVYDQVLDRLAERGKWVLLVLDNVANSGQIRDLLPRKGAHRAMVTTRDTLDLPRARHLALKVLDTPAALALLDEVLREHDLSDDRATSDPPQARKLTEACGGLPLALRIAAALLTDEPHLTAEELARQLQHVPGVDGYTRGEQCLDAVFDRSWRRLVDTRPEWARLLRLLCVACGPDLSTETAAVLADQPIDRVRMGLRGLRHAHLLGPTAPDRWELHDLVRAHTITRPAPGLSIDHLDAAEIRLLEHYICTADEADAQVRALPGQPVSNRFADLEDALTWLNTERACLVATVTHGTTVGHHVQAAQLTRALVDYLARGRHLTDLIAVAVHTDLSATHLEPQYQAAAATILGNALRLVRRFDDAVAAHERAIDLYRQLGDQHGEGSAWTNLGLALENVGRLEDALTAQQRAGGLFLRAGDQWGMGLAWNNHGVVLQKLGRFEHAIRAHQRAGELHRELKDQREEGVAWDNLGLALRELRRFEDAITAHKRAIDLYQKQDDRHREGAAWTNLGSAFRELRQFEDAIAAYKQAIDLFGDLDDRHGEGTAWNNLAVVQLDLGQLGRAIRCWKRARAAYTAADDTDSVNHIDQLLQTARLHLNQTTTA
jgi:tetratricopeptide (TPR) repeat protein/transcriptional regulator with XRE-family HTH domain